MDDVLRGWLTLSRLPGLGPVVLKTLLEKFSGPLQLLATPPQDWGLSEIRPDLATALKAWRTGSLTHSLLREVDGEIALSRRRGEHLVCMSDPRYPGCLAAIPDPPPVLYVRGEPGVLTRTTLAVVGSRKASSAGRRTAEEISADAAAHGMLVCSGLAYGIDAAAHRGALSVAGLSVGVVATGLDICYPRAHEGLAAQLCERGALVSEASYGSPPRKSAFPKRNRIISGLSRAVLVVEAALPSGSLITAQLAADQGREVFAVPGSIRQPNSRGCHQLLRDGAGLVENFEDLAHSIFGFALSPGDNAGAYQATLPSLLQDVLDSVGYEPTLIDDIHCAGAINPSGLLARLGELEALGLIERVAGGYRRC